MGAYLAASYGLLGLALIRQASQLGTNESAATKTVLSTTTSHQRQP